MASPPTLRIPALAGTVLFSLSFAGCANTPLGDLGFVPGLFVAFPVAIAGLRVRCRTSDQRVVIAIALVSLPIVYLFQFLGGAGPQWGGRYTLGLEAGHALGSSCERQLFTARNMAKKTVARTPCSSTSPPRA